MPCNDSPTTSYFTSSAAFFYRPDVVTVEVEHVHVDILKEFERMGVTVAPASRTVEIIQDKLRQKQVRSSVT